MTVRWECVRGAGAGGLLTDADGCAADAAVPAAGRHGDVHAGRLAGRATHVSKHHAAGQPLAQCLLSPRRIHQSTIISLPEKAIASRGGCKGSRQGHNSRQRCCARGVLRRPAPEMDVYNHRRCSRRAGVASQRRCCSGRWPCRGTQHPALLAPPQTNVCPDTRTRTRTSHILPTCHSCLGSSKTALGRATCPLATSQGLAT